MTDAYKNLGQSLPASGTLTDLYTVPAGKEAVVSTIVVCNTDTASATFRVSRAVRQAADERKQYWFYDTPLSGNQTRAFTFGPSMAELDVVRVQSSNGLVAFSLEGLEID